MRVLNSAFLLTMVLGCVVVAGCRPAQPPAPATQVVVTPAAAIPSDPGDPIWQKVPEYVAKLIPQDLVEPRLMENSTAEVRVRAASDGSRLAVRLEWDDDSPSDLAGPAIFCDGCAIQIPAKVEPTVPAPQMGEPGRSVEITFWNAAWQATVNGRGDSIRDIYPNAAVDHYPYQSQSLAQGSPEQKEMELRYAPARALGNAMTGQRDAPVQDLVAEGPGTMTPVVPCTSQGRGVRTAQGWAVVMTRRLPAGLSPQNGSQVAFAVWEGVHQEAGARKMRTGWIPLAIQEAP